MRKTLVLSPRYTPDSMALRDAALGMGWAVDRLQGWRPGAQLAEQDVIPYGEPLFAAVVADALELSLIEPPLSWMAELPFELKRREVRFADLATARALDSSFFVKPADDKCFPAKVYATGSELPSIDMLSASTPVLISEPVSWEGEFRCFVLEGRVATHSIYSRDGDAVEPEDGNWPASESERQAALEFATRVLQDAKVRFPPAGVIDVGVIRDRGWAVVEANACWGAGIYGCDPRKVLQTLSRACGKRAHLRQEDREWVLHRTTDAG